MSKLRSLNFYIRYVFCNISLKEFSISNSINITKSKSASIIAHFQFDVITLKLKVKFGKVSEYALKAVFK